MTQHAEQPPEQQSERPEQQSEPPLGRRELNKARTREAIVEALRVLVQQHPVHRITVEQLAEEAGISRRTFFNYYAGIPALVSEIVGASAQHVAGHLDEISAETSPFQHLRRLIRTVGVPSDLIEWMALLNLHGSDEVAAAAFERTVWIDKGTWLEQLLVDRLPEGVDPLYVATLATTIMNSFAAAERSWVAHRAPGATIDQAAVDGFTSLLDQALAYAEHGWAAPIVRKDP